MKENNRKSKLNKLLLIGIITVIIFWILIPSISIIYFGGAKSAGEFGDTFGIINALFSSLAFALLIYTSFMQREELELQRKELKLTRRELKRTRVEFEKSVEAQNRLIVLTQEEYKLQKEIQRSQIRPQLTIEGTKSESIPQGFYYELKLKTKYHKLKITKVSITENDFFTIEDNSLKQIINKYYEDEDEISISLSTQEKKSVQPEGLIITIVYQDLDLNKYQQQIKFEKDNFTIGNPKEIPFERFTI